MVDNMGFSQPGETVTATDSASKKASFLSTTNGKLIVGGVIVLLIAVGVAAALFLPQLLGGGSDDQSTGKVTKGASATKGAVLTSGTAEAVPVNPADKPLTDTYTMRDIFEPTIKAPTTTTPTQTIPGDTTSGSTSTTSNTLYLQSVATVNGVLVGTFTWNGQTYTAGEGDALGTTPWKVLTLSTGSAVMLYGDTRVTVSVGQGVTK